MMAAKANIATTGHNITNATTEGYSRQRTQQVANSPSVPYGKNQIGTGTNIKRTERINDEYVEKQIRNAAKDMAHFEEKDVVLRQTEDVFNEMGGEGLNRLMGRFFNEFRKLGNEPENHAIRESVRESSKSMVNDFRRIRRSVDEVRNHIDSRIEGYVREVNELASEVRDLNQRIAYVENQGASPNDLLDRRDQVIKQLGSYFDIQVHKDKLGAYNVDIKGVGPLVTGPNVERFDAFRTPADDQGKVENALDVHSTSSASSRVTHRLTGGKMGALLESRDRLLSGVQARLDELAFGVSEAVNRIHEQGFTAEGVQGVAFFKRLGGADRAAERLELSDEIHRSTGNIAAGAAPDAPGDNRIAVAIANIQNARVMNGGRTTMDDFYNSIVSDIGVANSKNRSAMNQQKDIQTQLGKIREQISGVSIDEETTHLLQFHQAFDASAKVIQVADEMLQTVLNLKR